jgi:iron complex transport system substrate-binding protein
MRGKMATLPPISVLAILLLVTACQGPGGPTQGEMRTVTDGAGRQVRLPVHPRRIISLAPSLTETLYAIGLGEEIVGVTTYCDYPAAALSKEKVGDTLTPNLERIIALKPDLVLITTSSQLENLARKLDGLSIPMFVVAARDVREIVDSIRTIGEVTGAVSRAVEVAAEMERRIQMVEKRVRDLPRLKVLYILQNRPLITAGRNTFINDLINIAGGVSISGQETAEYPQLSRESVLLRAPEVLVAPASHGTALVNLAELRTDFAATPAIRTNRIVQVEPDWIDRPGRKTIRNLDGFDA